MAAMRCRSSCQPPAAFQILVLTLSSALFALSIASNMSRSPVPLALYALRTSRMDGGGGCCSAAHVEASRLRKSEGAASGSELEDICGLAMWGRASADTPEDELPVRVFEVREGSPRLARRDVNGPPKFGQVSPFLLCVPSSHGSTYTITESSQSLHIVACFSKYRGRDVADGTASARQYK